MKTSSDKVKINTAGLDKRVENQYWTKSNRVEEHLDHPELMGLQNYVLIYGIGGGSNLLDSKRQAEEFAQTNKTEEKPQFVWNEETQSFEPTEVVLPLDEGDLEGADAQVGWGME